MTTLNDISLDQAKSYIDQIDFSQLMGKMAKKDKWGQNDLAKLCCYYRNFLYLIKKYHREDLQLPPSEEIDEFWHNHILDTKKYCQDCDAIFGKYLHHYPYFGMDNKSNEYDLQQSFEHTQKLYEKEFGERIYRVRPLCIHEIITTCFQIIKDFFVKK